MALKMNLTLTDNYDEVVSFPNAYIRVAQIQGDKKVLNAIVDTYKVKDGFNLYSKCYTFLPDLTGDNFIAQAYTYLKTLPEFAGAEDC